MCYRCGGPHKQNVCRMKKEDVTCSKCNRQGHMTKACQSRNNKSADTIWSEWRLTVIAATVRIALVDILDLSEVDIPAGVFLHPAVGWG